MGFTLDQHLCSGPKKPAAWGSLHAPPVWGHGAKGDTIYKPEFPAEDASLQHVGDNFVHGNPEIAVQSAPTADEAAPGTVFDEAKFVHRHVDTSVAHNAVRQKVRAQAFWFFITSAISTLEWLLLRNISTALSSSALVVAVVFGISGFFAYKMNRIAFLIAIAFYGITTLLLVAVAFRMNFGIVLVARSLFTRCALIYKHYRNYGLLTDLDMLEQEV